MGQELQSVLRSTAICAEVVRGDCSQLNRGASISNLWAGHMIAAQLIREGCESCSVSKKWALAFLYGVGWFVDLGACGRATL